MFITNKNKLSKSLCQYFATNDVHILVDLKKENNFKPYLELILLEQISPAPREIQTDQFQIPGMPCHAPVRGSRIACVRCSHGPDNYHNFTCLKI